MALKSDPRKLIFENYPANSVSHLGGIRGEGL